MISIASLFENLPPCDIQWGNHISLDRVYVSLELTSKDRTPINLLITERIGATGGSRILLRVSLPFINEFLDRLMRGAIVACQTGATWSVNPDGTLAFHHQGEPHQLAGL